MLQRLIELMKTHRRLMTGVTLAVFGVFVVVGLVLPRLYQVSTSLYVRALTSELTARSSVAGAEGAVGISDHMRILRSELVMGPLLKKIRQILPRQQSLTREELLQRLQVESSKNSRILELSYRDADPKVALRILKATMSAYQDALAQLHLAGGDKMRSVYAERLSQVRSARVKVAEQLSQYEAKTGTTDLTKKNDTLLRVNADYLTRLQETSARLVAVQQEIRQLQKTLKLSAEEVQGIAKVRANREILMMQEELGKQKSRLYDLKAVYTDQYPQVKEQTRLVENLETDIANRIRRVMNLKAGVRIPDFSELNEDLGRQMIERQAQAIGLQGQRNYYMAMLNQSHQELEKLSQQKKEVDRLNQAMATLSDAEVRLVQQLQDVLDRQSSLKNSSVFTVIAEPQLPHEQDYVFPWQPVELLGAGLLTSILLGLCVVLAYECFHPTVIDLSELPVITEIQRFSKAIPFGNLKEIYKRVSLTLNRNHCKSISIFHLCGAQRTLLLERTGFDLCPYSPSVFARQLATMFADMNIRTLLIDCTDVYEADQLARENILTVSGFQVYRYAGMELLDIVNPVDPVKASYDPNLLHVIPNSEQYELVLINASLSESEIDANLVSELTDATLVCVSKTATSGRALHDFLKHAKQKVVPLIGSVLFQ